MLNRPAAHRANTFYAWLVAAMLLAFAPAIRAQEASLPYTVQTVFASAPRLRFDGRGPVSGWEIIAEEA